MPKPTRTAPGQLDLFTPPSTTAPAAAPPKRRRRVRLKGLQLPLPIAGAEPMAINCKLDGPLFAIGDEVEFQTIPGGQWYRATVVGYAPWGAVISERHSDGYRDHRYPKYLRRVTDA
jgi:hypothetical protein